MQELHKKIDALLKALNDKNEALKKNVGSHAKLDIEYLRFKCVELYDVIHELQELTLAENSSTSVMDEVPFRLEPQKIETVTPEEIPPIETLPLEEKAQDPWPLEKNKDIEDLPLVVDPLSEDGTKSYDMPKFVPVAEKAPLTKKPEIKEKVAEKMVIDKLSGSQNQKSLHEAISIQQEEKLAEKFSNLKITKITEAIDISKRFEFQNNLFGGSNQRYSQSIISLDEAKTKFSALEVFNHLAEENHWDMKNELVQELKSFIGRKF